MTPTELRRHLIDWHGHHHSQVQGGAARLERVHKWDHSGQSRHGPVDGHEHEAAR